MKKISLILAALVLFVCGCTAKQEPADKLSVVATVFPAYDFARAVCGDDATVSMLLEPGVEVHSFEPTAEDIIKIEHADLFIYTGGEGDVWVERILKSIGNPDLNVIKMVDESALIHTHHDHNHGHSHEGADEHVWLSPDNAKSIVSAICGAVSGLDPENADRYQKRAGDYCAEITLLASETKEIIASAKHRTIAVADRFPLKYLCEYYSLEYTAAFDACDHLADADAKTVMRLIDTVKKEGLSHVFYIENGSGYLADTVCEATGAEKLMLNSMHTVSHEDFCSGLTYLDIMEHNKTVLERGLN